MRTGIIAILIAATALGACNTPKATTKNPKPASTANHVVKQDSAVITVARTPCYGHCPAYSMSIYANGAVHFEGQRDVTKIGLYMKSIGADSVAALVKQFEQADVWNMEDAYPSVAVDLPTTYVTYRRNGKVKMIKGVYKAPPALTGIVLTLYAIADSDEGWFKTGNLPMKK